MRLVCDLVGKMHSFSQGIFTKHLSQETMCSAIEQVLQNDKTKQNVINTKDEEKTKCLRVQRMERSQLNINVCVSWGDY